MKKWEEKANDRSHKDGYHSREVYLPCTGLSRVLSPASHMVIYCLFGYYWLCTQKALMADSEMKWNTNDKTGSVPSHPHKANLLPLCFCVSLGNLCFFFLPHRTLEFLFTQSLQCSPILKSTDRSVWMLQCRGLPTTTSEIVYYQVGTCSNIKVAILLLKASLKICKK